MREILSFLATAEGQGETVALVFGGAHDFGIEDCGGQKKADLPVIQAWSRPSHPEENPYHVGAELFKAQNDPGKQLSIIQAARTVDVFAFPALSADAQASALNSLKKLVVDPNEADVASAELCKKYMEKFARSDEVRQLIQKQYEDGLGVFRYYNPQGVSSQYDSMRRQ